MYILAFMTVNDKEFHVLIENASIAERISSLAKQINTDYAGKDLVALVVLNGAFIFASDLIRKFTLEPEVSFVKLKSYHGTSSSGRVQTLIGLMHDLKNKDVLIVEDIVDTGLTMKELVKMVEEQRPASVRICTLLVKEDVFRNKYPLDYVGFSIPNKFVVGYGLDYDEKGRHLPDIYQLK